MFSLVVKGDKDCSSHFAASFLDIMTITQTATFFINHHDM